MYFRIPEAVCILYIGKVAHHTALEIKTDWELSLWQNPVILIRLDWRKETTWKTQTWMGNIQNWF